MLKTRIIPTLLFKDFTLVKGQKFDSWRRIGSVMQMVKLYNMREVDELIFLDITATNELRSPDFSFIDDFADECFMPLTVGGGISCIDDIQKLFSVGADKVALNSIVFDKPNLVAEASKIFGSQSIVVSIDCLKVNSNTYKVCSHSGNKITSSDPLEHARKVQDLGAGEILLTSIDRDGTFEGYDLDLVKKVADAVEIPLIASGGARNYQDMADVIIKSNASAAAASSMFLFTEQTPIEAKRYLATQNIATRL